MITQMHSENYHDPTTKPTIYVVDDDRAVRDSLRVLLKSIEMNVKTYATARKFLNTYDPVRPGCLVLDFRLLDMSGLELQETLQQKLIDIPIIMISGYGDIPSAVQAMKMGAIEFLEKPFRDQVLLECIQKAILVDTQNRREKIEKKVIADRWARLTAREQQVMDLVVAGKANKAIAHELGIKQKTVEFHRARVMAKMKSKSVVDLVKMASKFDDD